MKIYLYLTIIFIPLVISCGLPEKAKISYDTDQSLPSSNAKQSVNQRLAAGHLHTCVITNESTVKCWGSNSNGQIGDGSTSDRLFPTEVGNLGFVTSITAGFSHTCALISNGTVRCWGGNGNGQLGSGGITDTYYPTKVANLSSVTSISAGYHHTCALISDGTVKCWGDNTNQQLTSNNTGAVLTPVSLAANGEIKSVSSGHNHTCWITSGSAIECWGKNTIGQIGNGSTSAYVGTPTAINGSGIYSLVRPANNHTCGLLSTGSIQCWGGLGYGELGNRGMNTPNQTNPVDVDHISSAISLSSGEDHSCALLGSGDLYCWGKNDRGQVAGDGDVTMKTSPVQVPINAKINEVVTGNQHTCVLTNTDIVKCWGSNSNGQIGDGSIIDRSTPVTILSL